MNSTLEKRARELSAQIAGFGRAPAKPKAKKIYTGQSFDYKSLAGKPVPWSADLTPKQVKKEQRVNTFAPQYFKSKDGVTPMKGVDYATPTEIQEMHDAVFNKIKESAAVLLIPQVLAALREEGISTSDLKDADAFLMRARDGMVTRYKIEEMMHGGSNASANAGVPLTPTGTVNGVNAVFGVVSRPSSVVSDGSTYFEGVGYSYAALSITMDIPPSSYIRYYA